MIGACRLLFEEENRRHRNTSEKLGNSKTLKNLASYDEHLYNFSTKRTTLVTDKRKLYIFARRLVKGVNENIFGIIFHNLPRTQRSGVSGLCMSVIVVIRKSAHSAALRARLGSAHFEYSN